MTTRQVTTERGWLSCTEPEPMVRLLRRLGVPRRPAGRRKLRLFGCACVRRQWHRATDPRSRTLVEVAERHADGLADRRELVAAERAARVARNRGSGLVAVGKFARVPPSCPWGFAELSDAASPQPAWDFALVVTLLPRMVQRTADHGPEDVAQADLLREILGSPFTPLPSRTFPAHVVGLALACYEAFPAVSPDFLVLADALEELGEGAAASHCREALHVRGCAVLDWVLGRA